ncbi:NAD(P)H-dependent oxidoreductase [Pseudovibrio exalbescens]|uniref:NAD(P)H-dependent oxidoreductase n=1 Tax=Pseudovibrio exalbescens TaxID=197461 RepID=UPI002366F6EC|nr:NAD(P)H-dependent oxidoreductase [Pseudovibrio exalbescens]MDD7911628.1 NAD(P)H-dependent oxidoreductase [Pseudovibrio exalbescens]
MKKVLILYGHPRNDRSEMNLPMSAIARSLDGVTLVDLYAEYPTFDISVEKEQQRLLDHDIVAFQHPLYWYSVPALLKEWQDLVLEHGFAYGSHGTALAGKLFFNAVTCGASRSAYRHDGAYRRELRDLLAPFEETARLCKMRFLPPFEIYASGHAREDGRLEKHLADYHRLLVALVNDRVDLERAERGNSLAEDLDNILLPDDSEAAS